MLLALLVGGYLSDTFGRRKIFCGGCTIVVVATFIAVFPKAFWIFIVGRIFIGIGSGRRARTKLDIQTPDIQSTRLSR